MPGKHRLQTSDLISLLLPAWDLTSYVTNQIPANPRFNKPH